MNVFTIRMFSLLVINFMIVVDSIQFNLFSSGANAQDKSFQEIECKETVTFAVTSKGRKGGGFSDELTNCY